MIERDAKSYHLDMANRTPSRSIVLALAGDTMLGRSVAEKFVSCHRPALFSDELEDICRSADLFVLNLECCISERGQRWSSPGKPFFFRAPPDAAAFLADVGVNCVTLANNHALDFGAEALLDTINHLESVGIPVAGAGATLSQARTPAVIESNGFKLAVVGITDHPKDFSAKPDQPGVAFVDLRNDHIPCWLLETLAAARAEADAVLFSPHWGPNLTVRPPEYVRRAAATLRGHVSLIAGHSAHVFHGVERNVVYDLGDLINDYVSMRPSHNLLIGILNKFHKEVSGLVREVSTAAASRAGDGELPVMSGFWQHQRWRVNRIIRMIRARIVRPDLGLMFLVTLTADGPTRLEAIPLKIGRCRTDIAAGPEAALVQKRFRRVCAELDTTVQIDQNRLIVVSS